MAAKDKTPNRTLAIAIEASCNYTDKDAGRCISHGVVSKSVDGLIRRRCIEHISK